MAVTGQQVFDLAMGLIDEVTETGYIAPENPEYYKKKACLTLTTLQTELLPLSINPVVVSDLSQELLLSDKIALLVLPYGIAAHLLLSENANTASFFNDRYEELKRKRPTSIIKITDVYVNGE